MTKILTAIILLLPITAYSFSSVTSYKRKGYDIHAQITHKALKKLKFGEISIKNILSGNLIHDYLRVKINAAELHCDRNRGVSHEQAARNCQKKGHELLDNAVASIKSGDYLRAQHYYGNALHIFQDFISHSNYIDLKKLTRLTVKDFMLKRTKSLSSKLRMTGWDHRTKKGEKAGQLKGDKFSHDLFCKDNPIRNKESQKSLKSYKNRTKFEAAFSEAVSMTKETALLIKSKVSKKQWDSFRRIKHL